MPDSMERPFQQIFAYTNDAIFIIDPARDAILEANPKACAMLGYSREEAVSLLLSALCPGEMSSVKTFAQTVFEYGQGWTNALPLAPKAGQPMPAEMSAVPVDMDGVRCLLVLVRDATDIKQVEEALRKTSDEMEQVMEEKTLELRTAHEILKEQALLRSVAEKALRKAEKELRRFQKMVGDGQAVSQPGRREADDSSRR
ncbi:MAG: PAS domain S-box protein [Nitrospirae bacterium]|nr:MAG: PAS domain S-box protein [Nitrospirota bacterium]